MPVVYMFKKGQGNPQEAVQKLVDGTKDAQFPLDAAFIATNNLTFVAGELLQLLHTNSPWPLASCMPCTACIQDLPLPVVSCIHSLQRTTTPAWLVSCIVCSTYQLTTLTVGAAPAAPVVLRRPPCGRQGSQLEHCTVQWRLSSKPHCGAGHWRPALADQQLHCHCTVSGRLGALGAVYSVVLPSAFTSS